MIKRTRYLSSATGMLLTLFWTSTLATQPWIADQNTRIENLLQLSGFAEQLHALPGAVEQSVDQLVVSGALDGPFGQSDYPVLKRAVIDAFSVDVLQGAVEQALSNTLSAADVDDLTDFYDSAQGQRLRATELSQSILTGRSRFDEWYALGGMATLPADYQAAVLELEAAMQATQSAVETMIGMQVALQVSITPALPAEEQRTPETLLAAAQAQRSHLTSLYQESSRQTLAFIFQNQPLQDIQAYTRMLQSEPGHRYVQATNNGLSVGLFQATEKLGARLQQLMNERRGLTL